MQLWRNPGIAPQPINRWNGAAPEHCKEGKEEEEGEEEAVQAQVPAATSGNKLRLWDVKLKLKLRMRVVGC